MVLAKSFSTAKVDNAFNLLSNLVDLVKFFTRFNLLNDHSPSATVFGRERIFLYLNKLQETLLPVEGHIYSLLLVQQTTESKHSLNRLLQTVFSRISSTGSEVVKVFGYFSVTKNELLTGFAHLLSLIHLHLILFYAKFIRVSSRLIGIIDLTDRME